MKRIEVLLGSLNLAAEYRNHQEAIIRDCTNQILDLTRDMVDSHASFFIKVRTGWFNSFYKVSIRRGWGIDIEPKPETLEEHLQILNYLLKDIND